MLNNVKSELHKDSEQEVRIGRYMHKTHSLSEDMSMKLTMHRNVKGNLKKFNSKGIINQTVHVCELHIEPSMSIKW